MNIKKFFTENDLAEIENAVKDAELKTSGEIVPFVAEYSDVYAETVWQFGFMVFVFNTLFFTLLTPHFSILNNPKIMACFTIGISMLFVIILMLCRPLRMLFTFYDRKKMRVKETAQQKFLSEEVFATQDRTGILIYLSLAERRVEIIGDSGINAKVEKEKWQAIADVIVNGMKKKQYKQCLIDAIGMCGDLLQQNNVQRRDDDTNELSDSVRFDKSSS